jgi:hypothetical protein
VARQALARQGIAVVEARAQESGSIEVTGVARGVGHDMRGGLGRRHDALAQGMASVASPGRAFEHTAQMAGLAGRRGMTAGQRKTGRQVIEIAPAHRRFRRGGLQRKHHQHYGKHIANYSSHSSHDSPPYSYIPALHTFGSIQKSKFRRNTALLTKNYSLHITHMLRRNF